MITKKYLRENRAELDAEDAEILKTLAERHRCQHRLITDGGTHYIFCGGYSREEATEVRPGVWRCEKHQKER